jgi:hypothetical protein
MGRREAEEVTRRSLGVATARRRSTTSSTVLLTGGRRGDGKAGAGRPAADLRAEPLRRRGEEETIRDLKRRCGVRGGGENGLGFGEQARRVGGSLIYAGGAGRPLVLVGRGLGWPLAVYGG